LAKAERILRVSRRDIGRAEQIVGISDAGSRRVNLRVKRDVPAIARLPPDEQVAVVHELAAPKPRAAGAGAAAPSKDPQRAKASGEKPATPAAAEPTRARDESEDFEGTHREFGLA
jgi:hypothetical protein